MSNWQNVSATEMYTFLAFTMLSGLMGKGQIRDYWSTDPLLSTSIFSQYFKRNRYQNILRFLHFANNEDVGSNDRLKKTKPIINDLKQKFSNCVNPAQNLCIDASLMLWEGRLIFKQYILSKRNRFGVESFCLVDCKTKFVLDFIVYTGSNTEYQMTAELGLSGSVAMELMGRYLSKGHHLYVDDWFASSALFEILHRNRTGACGTVRKNRQRLPSLIIKLKSGEIQYLHTDILLALKWQDKREVHMLSTTHSKTYTNSGKVDWKTGQEIRKPACIIDYNTNKGAVDQVNMQIAFSECLRKSMKWYKKVFFHLLDIAVYNAFVISKMCGNISLHLSDCRLEIIREILRKHGSQRPSIVGRPSTRDYPLRFTARHFISLIPQIYQSKQPQRRCVVCAFHNIRHDTSYYCHVCDAPLCVVDCFEDYHTKINYKWFPETKSLLLHEEMKTTSRDSL